MANRTRVNRPVRRIAVVQRPQLFLLLASAALVIGCDDPKIVGPLPSPKGDPSQVLASPDERKAIVALEELGATIPLNNEGRAKKVYLARSKKLSSKDLVHLKALRDVDELKLSFTKIDDAALANIAHLDKLEILSLLDTKVTGPGLIHLAKLKNLRILYLGKTSISDDGLAQLAGLTSLEMLFLEQTKITDEGLKHLGELKKLNYLDISGTEVTDAAVPHLAKLAGLQRAMFKESKMTKEGVADLRSRLPGLGQAHF